MIVERKAGRLGSGRVRGPLRDGRGRDAQVQAGRRACRELPQPRSAANVVNLMDAFEERPGR